MIRESRPPLAYELAKYMLRHGVRGGHRLLQAVYRSGIMDRNFVYKIDRKTSVVIPMHLSESYRHYDRHFVAIYENDVIAAMATEAASMLTPVTYVDCGADIGLFASKVALHVPNVGQIIAFEPNSAVREYLGRNLHGLRVPSQSYGAAVSDFNGNGVLREPDYSNSFHARFLEPAPEGDIPVRTIDSFNIDLPGGLLLKIDVEGGELNVIRGAVETLRRAPEFTIVFEAHPGAIRRSGVDSMECIRAIHAIRKCRFYICEDHTISLDIDRSYLEQVPDGKIFDVICRST
jgi:FkbM family methyltransferase